MTPSAPSPLSAVSGTVRRSLTVGAALLALTGCSFTGSASDPDASADRSSAAPTGSPTVGTPIPSSTAPGSTTSGGGDGGGSGATATRPASSAPAGGGTHTGAAPGAGTGEGSGGSRPDRCHTSERTGELVVGSAGAGQRYATLALRDTGDRTCTIDGYGGIGLYDSAGQRLPTNQVRVAAPPPQVVTVQPGGTVTSQLHWSVVPGTGDGSGGTCQPEPATLRVIPPDETDGLSLPWSGGPVCEAGTVQQQAYVAG